MNRGFTIVEILITLVVMVVLLTLGTISISSLLRNARDAERQEDIGAIARGLEQRYNKGNSYIVGSDGRGSYPTVSEFQHMRGDNIAGFNPTQVSGGYFTKVLTGTNDSTFLNPSSENQFVLECQSSCGAADNTTQLNTVFAANDDPYVYSPENASGNICTTAPCVSFTLYWLSEVSGSRQSVESNHR